jgi:PAS domain S-box-containing protein
MIESRKPIRHRITTRQGHFCMRAIRAPGSVPSQSGQQQAHSVQFYSDDAFLLEDLKQFIGSALADGSSAVVIATKAHSDILQARLASDDLDLAQAIAEGRYLSLDASEVLGRIMPDGRLDAARFSELIGGVFAQAAAASRNEDQRVVAFGEMVAVLWAEGDAEAAIQLEKLWNTLAGSHSFSLRCAYPTHGFRREADADSIRKICAEHSLVISDESLREVLPEEERPRNVLHLPQQPQSAPPEMAWRRREERFRLLVESVYDYAIFMLDPAGRVTSWNKGAERIEGYKPAEIIGRHFACFYPQDDLESRKPQELLELAAMNGRSEAEGWRIPKNGQPFWAHVTLTKILDETGRLIGFGNVTRDVTEQRRAHLALQRQKERFQLFVDAVQDHALFTLDPEGLVGTWNIGAERLQGYKAAEIIGQHFSCFYVPEDVHAGKPGQELEIAARDGRFAGEGWVLRKDGSRFWASEVITAIRNETGALLGFGIVTRDLTERRRAQENLAQTEERIRLVVEAVQDYAIFMLDPTGHVLTWSPGAERIKGYSAPEIIGKHFSVFYPEVDIRRGKPAWELEIAAKEGRFEDEDWRLRKDGSRFWANVIITAVRDRANKLVGYAKVTRDYTERMRTLESLDEARRRLYESEKSLRELSLHLLRTQDEERRRIGREIHDSLGQYLSVLKMKLHSISSASGMRDEAAGCMGLVDECIKEVRTISYLLYPPMLEEMGLASAIPWYLEGFSKRCGIKTSFEITQGLERLPRDVELALFRVLQESLTNVQRHSGSPTADIRIFQSGRSVSLQVTDHGHGMPADVLAEGSADWMGSLGIGLRGMSERLRQLGGTLEMSSTDTGTQLCATVPMETGPALDGSAPDAIERHATGKERGSVA